MRFLIDNALSRVVASLLNSAGHDAVHVRDYQMQQSKDDEIFERAAKENRILISADTDFGTLLSVRRETKPSVVLFRRGARQPDVQADLLVNVLPGIESDLLAGCIVVLDNQRIRIRRLPIGGE